MTMAIFRPRRGSKTAAWRELICVEARTWLKTPYHHHARVKGAGVDCGKFLQAVFEDIGLVPEIAVTDYPPDWYMHREEERYLGYVEKHAHKIAGPPLPGDIVLYNYGRCISHGAIVLEWPQIIHAYQAASMVTLDDGIANRALAERQVGFWSVFK